jgi:creatinine amidohydrolase/Fe(II)-dependent formamide hydrolase-like protein
VEPHRGYWNEEVRTSVNPGGCAHAGELETSMYLHVDGDAVRVDRIEGDLPDYMALPGRSTAGSTST